MTPYGRIMALDEENVYSYGRDPEFLCNSSVLEYRLYSASRQSVPESKRRKTTSNSDNWMALAKLPVEQVTALDYNWQIGHPPLVVRAMVLANNTLFVAGPPDVVDEVKMWGRSRDPAFQEKMKEQVAALNGAQGAVLWAVSRQDGKKLSAKKLNFTPAFDGLIAARGKLFVTTIDGQVVCLK